MSSKTGITDLLLAAQKVRLQEASIRSWFAGSQFVESEIRTADSMQSHIYSDTIGRKHHYLIRGGLCILVRVELCNFGCLDEVDVERRKEVMSAAWEAYLAAIRSAERVYGSPAFTGPYTSENFPADITAAHATRWSLLDLSVTIAYEDLSYDVPLLVTMPLTPHQSDDCVPVP